MVLRGTKKFLDLVGARSEVLVNADPADDDWYANLLWLDRRKCLLLAHAGTLFPVFVADVHKADLMPLGPVVVRLINQQLASETLPEDSLGKLDSSSVQLARTASRSVLGYMNETATYCSYAIADYGGLERCDIAALNRELRRELHMSRRPPGYFVPIDEVIKRVGVSRRSDLGIVT